MIMELAFRSPTLNIGALQCLFTAMLRGLLLKNTASIHHPALDGWISSLLLCFMHVFDVFTELFFIFLVIFDLILVTFASLILDYSPFVSFNLNFLFSAFVSA